MKLKFLLAAAAGLILSVSSVANAGIIDIDFIIGGNTYTEPWSVTNNSTDGLELESFVLDLRQLSTYCFDIDSSSGCDTTGGQAFTPNSGVIATDYVNYTLTNEAGGIDFLDFLQINFNDFGFGETFSWLIDVDSLSTPTVSGNDLIGSAVNVRMSDGNVYYGNLVAVDGNSGASRFEISQVPEPSTLAILALGIMGFAARRFKKQ
jgi:hypothetical protein